ncbi:MULTISPECIES: FUSC family protein [Achromobacter]|uniref:FUSC family membrane protein n=1 Tax=Achromobacter spanius TaxID=217203 RepID=A0ABY8GT12_9BURK|nr:MULTISPECIES: FUSC family membrane protein [Achromobacter]WAI83075.1 FUSC family protein [Achromobacter spanius]WEX93159.1 FUSC family protein [Achromobacter sp. SS2-2022]WFP07684.1 FUSC family membrane protein [Achromobacter spanius]
MDLRIASIRRFLYSHYFFGGVRQGVGMLLPVLVLGGLFGNYTTGLVATFGAQCLAIIDQPGGPQRHRTNEMLGGAALGTITVIITGLASTNPILIWLVVIAQCFVYSMFTVFGKRGGLIGFAGLLLMTLTMHSPLQPHEVFAHAVATLGGALFYVVFSLGFSRLFWLREEQQAMSVALFATADYVAARAAFYDETADLDEAYRTLIQRQSVMTEKHQAARDMVLRALPRGKGVGDRQRVMIWNMFVDMLQLLDTLVATHTDYAALRRTLAGNDCLMFMRDALVKMSLELNRIALDVSRGRQVQYRSSAKAELRAIEYEIEQLKQQGLGEREPEMLALIIQVLRRLRNSARIVDRLADHTAASPDAKPTDVLRINKSLTRFISRQEFRFGLLTSNLRLDSPHFRYALRVTAAAAIAMTLASRWLSPEFSAHNYWIMLTIVIIMKPGFALTRQRNGWRLGGTLIGCICALLLFNLTDRPEILFAVLLGACIMGNSLVQLNYMASAIFNTLFVVLVFHFVSPGTVSMSVIGERAIDTLLGCALALICSYILPWWEARYLKPLAAAATRANREYLLAGLRYVEAMQTHAGPATNAGANAGTTAGTNTATTTAANAATNATAAADTPAVIDADLAWRLARKNVHIAFSNFAEAFYRMMSEPKSHQLSVPELNNLLIQNHVLASQITAAIPILAALPKTPEAVQLALNGMVDLLDEKRPQIATPLPTQFDTAGEQAALAYPLKQMLKAAHMIRQELQALADPTHSPPVAAAA